MVYYYIIITFRFKLNGISTLLSRAYRVCSTFSFLHNEFEFLKVFFRSNGFCTSFIESRIRKCFNRIMMGFILNHTGGDEKPIYLSFPYLGPYSEKLKSELFCLLSKYFPNSKFTIILVNKFTIGSFFNY